MNISIKYFLFRISSCSFTLIAVFIRFKTLPRISIFYKYIFIK
nr:MAG TPA: hypothetical protein [Caudoviricetes sp.]